MAKVTPKNAPKTAPATASKEAAAEAMEAKIAALAGPIAELCGERIQAELSRRDTTFAIVDAVIEARDENELDDKATRRLVILAFAEASGVGADEITKAVKDRTVEAVRVNTYISDTLALVAPKHEKALANVRKRIEKGENVTLPGALDAARNGNVPKGAGKPGRPDKQTAAAKVPFEDQESLEKAFDNLYAQAIKSSFTLDEIDTVVAERLETNRKIQEGDEDAK